MADYAVDNQFGGTQQNLTTTYKTILSVLAGSTPRRGFLYDIEFGLDGTPADNVIVFSVFRQTADDGTKTNVTPNPVDPADPAFTGLSRANYSAEPTVGVQVLPAIAINQRATFEWVPAPDSELVFPATANNGLAVRAKSPTYTSTALVGCFVDE